MARHAPELVAGMDRNTHIDNVLASTDEIMRQVIAEYTSCRVQLAYGDITEFNYYECSDKFGQKITKTEWAAIHELFSEEKNLQLIRPADGAIEALAILGLRGRINLVTSRLPHTTETTNRWLSSHGFLYHSLTTVPHRSKHVHFSHVQVAVEDDYDQALAFAKAGTPCILISHPWNRHKPRVSGISWVNSWKEALPLL